MRTAAAWLLLVAVTISGCDAPSPKSQWRDLEGNTVETGGRVLVVNYWAEWCAPCREEIPELNAFYRQHAERVLVLGINFDQLPADQVRAQAEKFGIEFPVLASEPAERWGQPRPQVLPTTLFIDADGVWRRTLVGPQTAQSLQEALANMK
ncbi:TlpA family protein disulfide reductase [Microbulbifer sp. SA54]|uniref:TlpA family protein disulfide reductase n=1 Tax=Microbulbifer sp. SA54 TaxID=3401577 RepID=UPI003AAD9798